MTTRKLSAIMFTDIVGYTSMMAENEQTALNAVSRNREIQQAEIARHEGAWLKQMGDGTLSSFDSAINAVNCAIAIQEKMRENPEFKLRIGIHLGDVVFTESDVYGNGVNIASRIEPMAAAGGVAISGQVRDTLVGSQDIDLLYLGEKELKHVSHPIKIFAVNSHDLPVPAVDPSMVGTVEKQAQKSGSSWLKVAALMLGIGIVLVLLNRANNRQQNQAGDQALQPLAESPVAEIVSVPADSEPEAVNTQTDIANLVSEAEPEPEVQTPALSQAEVAREIAQAISQRENGQFMAAENTLQALMASNPETQVVLQNGVLLATVGRLNEALPYLQLAHSEDDSGNAAWWLAGTLKQLGQIEEARAVTDNALAQLDLDAGDPITRLLQLRQWEISREQGQTISRQTMTGFDNDIRRVITAVEGMIDMIDRNPRGALNRIRTRVEEADIQPDAMVLLVEVLANQISDPEVAMRMLERRPGLPTGLWGDAQSALRQSSDFKAYVQDRGLADYWQQSGNWADKCQPTAGNDFACF